MYGSTHGRVPTVYGTRLVEGTEENTGLETCKTRGRGKK
jgi:hypothetical protein